MASSARFRARGRAPGRPLGRRAAALSLLACVTGCAAATAPVTAPIPAVPPPLAAGPEARTAQYFAALAPDSPERLAFLRAMPKGGDLHVHLSGAIYA